MSSDGSPDQDVEISSNPERDEFMKKLEAYHTERGTVLEDAPKVGSRIVDLHKLYRRITAEGGYDVVSDTRSNKLMWRKIGQDFHLGSANSPTLAFTLKTVYYKNLAAYEIKNFHNKEPPPKEILEDVTAKGGDLLKRTSENFTKPMTKEERLAESAGMDSTNTDPATPSKENVEQDDSGTSGRATRGLRHAPPPRQLFQGEVSQTRSSRHVSKEAGSPAPNNPFANVNGVYAANGVPQSLAAYEPRPQLPAQLRPVMTPGNNYDKFKEEQKRIRELRASRDQRGLPKSRHTPGLVPPGTGFQGPSIYTRTLNSLQSGILEEQEYALFHLTKISHERGDRFEFAHFKGLAEALMEKILEVGSLVLDVEWQIVYDYALDHDFERIVDRETGLGDRIASIEFSRKRKRVDKLAPEELSRRMVLVNEAALILRNMVMLRSNAMFVSQFPTVRALLIILFNLPDQADTAEIQQYGLDMAQELSRYFTPQEDDQFFQSLVTLLDRNDRGIIISATRSICRMGLEAQRSPPVHSIHPRVIQRLTSWIVIEDEELRSVALDLLHQYTVQPENVAIFAQNTHIQSFVRQLSRLLLHGARSEERKELPVRKPTKSSTTSPTDHATSIRDIPIPRISKDHIDTLLGYNEPERSTQWLRACFEEDSEGEITQIALWQAYQVPFTPYATTHPLLPAKDFITNVSQTFSNASAQVMTEAGGTPRFVIKGIKARRVPVDPKGKRFLRCLWQVDAPTPTAEGEQASSVGKETDCNVFARDARALWEHIITSHIGLSKLPENENKYDFTPKPGINYACRWSTCKRYPPPKPNVKEPPGPYQVGMHVKTHMPDTTEKSFIRSKHNQEDTEKKGLKSQNNFFTTGTRTYQSKNTAVDEKNDAAGLPLSACLVLRNIARGLARAGDQSRSQSPEAMRSGHGDAHMGTANQSIQRRKVDRERDLMSLAFSGVKEQIFHVMAVNQSLKDYLPGLIQAIEEGGA